MHIGNRIFAICDAEREYAFRFMEHLRRKQNLSFQIRVFTDPEKLIAFARKTPLDILLISERSMTDAVAGLPVNKLIVLSEGTGSVPSGFSYPSLYKYQSTDTIVREIMNSYGADAEKGGSIAPERKIQAIGVFSPTPYAQKMLFSMAVGMAAAKERRTLYLNLEAFSGFEEFMGCHFERNLSDLVYLFRQNSAGFAEKMNGMIYSAGALDYLPPIRTPSDYLEISGEEWIRFFETIGGTGSYDTIVLDLGQSIPDILMLLSYCSRILVPVSGDALSDAREHEFESLLEATDNLPLAGRMEKVVPPQMSVPADGKNCVERLPWSSLGGYAASLCG
jgi:hypothetical protein